MKFGRNDPCPCGSGKKYKKCCLSAGKSPSTVSHPRRFRFEAGSYGGPESCMPSISCLKEIGDSRWEYHFVLVREAEPSDPGHAYAVAAADLDDAFARRANSNSDEDVALLLKERGYVAVHNFQVVDDNTALTASPEFLAAATKTFQKNVRDSRSTSSSTPSVVAP